MCSLWNLKDTWIKLFKKIVCKAKWCTPTPTRKKRADGEGG